jgi:hypothetical protein
MGERLIKLMDVSIRSALPFLQLFLSRKSQQKPVDWSPAKGLSSRALARKIGKIACFCKKELKLLSMIRKIVGHYRNRIFSFHGACPATDWERWFADPSRACMERLFRMPIVLDVKNGPMFAKSVGSELQRSVM